MNEIGLFNLPPVCPSCGREQGALESVRMGGRPEQPPLGQFETCRACGALACPECVHEKWCCENGQMTAGVAPPPVFPGKAGQERT